MVKGYDETKHPRDDSGHWIAKDKLAAAKTNPKLAAALRASVTKPAELAKLNLALGTKAASSGGSADKSGQKAKPTNWTSSKSGGDGDDKKAKGGKEKTVVSAPPNWSDVSILAIMLAPKDSKGVSDYKTSVLDLGEAVSDVLGDDAKKALTPYINESGYDDWVAKIRWTE
jgi:type IV secretory pathway TrbL component